MAAYGLPVYQSPGKQAATLAVIGTLMIPMTIILVPVYLVVTELGLTNSLWAVILPGPPRRPAGSLPRQSMLPWPRVLFKPPALDKPPGGRFDRGFGRRLTRPRLPVW